MAILQRWRSRAVVPALIIVLGLVGTGCLGLPSAANTHDLMDANPFTAANTPDPAWAPIYYGVAGIYGGTTGDLQLPRGFAYIPSYVEPIPGVKNVSTSSLYDALPSGPSIPYPFTGNGRTWAPTVRLISGQYLMMYSEGIVNHGNCIGAATSSNGVTFTAVTNWIWCSPLSGAYGLLDPDLFVDPNNGNVWLIYSDQYPPFNFSQVEAQQLTSNGLGIVGSASVLFTLQQMQVLNGGLGGTPEVENPSMTTDDYNYYDVTFSLGTWTSNATYNIAEVGCGGPNGFCATNDAGILKTGSGGASALVDSTPANNWVIWASNTINDGSTNALRTDYGGPTNEFYWQCCTSSQATPATNGLQKVTNPGYPIVAYTILDRSPLPGSNVKLGVTDPATVISSPYHGTSTLLYSAP